MRIGNLLTAAILLVVSAVMAGSLSISVCAKDRFDEQSLRKNPVGDFGTGRKLEVQIIDDGPVKREHRQAPGVMRYPDVPELHGVQPGGAQSRLTGQGAMWGSQSEKSRKVLTGTSGWSSYATRAKTTPPWWCRPAPRGHSRETPVEIQWVPAPPIYNGSSYVDIKEVLRGYWQRQRAQP